MAIEILRTHVAHNVRHDLESFFWLLLWVVLRYTRTTSWPEYRLYGEVFGAHTERESAANKALFLDEEINWEVKDNKPLTTLVSKFKDLVDLQRTRKWLPSQPLTFEKVLALFDEALSSPGWPQNDHAMSFKMPSKTAPSITQGASQAATGSRGGEKRREAPGEPDPLSLPAHKRAHIYRRPVRNLNNADGVQQQAVDNAPHS